MPVAPAHSPARHALVAEDDAELRLRLVDELVREGFVVHGVADGRRMWRCTFDPPAYELVVADLRLPVVDGLTVLEDFHARAPRARLVVMTAIPDETTRRRALLLGAAVLVKPFGMDALRAAVRRPMEPAAFRGRS